MERRARRNRRLGRQAALQARLADQQRALRVPEQPLPFERIELGRPEQPRSRQGNLQRYLALVDQGRAKAKGKADKGLDLSRSHMMVLTTGVFEQATGTSANPVIMSTPDAWDLRDDLSQPLDASMDRAEVLDGYLPTMSPGDRFMVSMNRLMKEGKWNRNTLRLPEDSGKAVPHFTTLDQAYDVAGIMAGHRSDREDPVSLQENGDHYGFVDRQEHGEGLVTYVPRTIQTTGFTDDVFVFGDDEAMEAFRNGSADVEVVPLVMRSHELMSSLNVNAELPDFDPREYPDVEVPAFIVRLRDNPMEED
jgi:hypothetical protein